MRANILDIEERELRDSALRRYPYLARYCLNTPLHMACCLCYPRKGGPSQDRHSTPVPAYHLEQERQAS